MSGVSVFLCGFGLGNSKCKRICLLLLGNGRGGVEVDDHKKILEVPFTSGVSLFVGSIRRLRIPKGNPVFFSQFDSEISLIQLDQVLYL